MKDVVVESSLLLVVVLLFSVEFRFLVWDLVLVAVNALLSDTLSNVIVSSSVKFFEMLMVSRSTVLVEVGVAVSDQVRVSMVLLPSSVSDSDGLTERDRRDLVSYRVKVPNTRKPVTEFVSASDNVAPVLDSELLIVYVSILEALLDIEDDASIVLVKDNRIVCETVDFGVEERRCD